MAPSENN